MMMTIIRFMASDAFTSNGENKKRGHLSLQKDLIMIFFLFSIILLSIYIIYLVTGIRFWNTYCKKLERFNVRKWNTL